MRSKTLKHIDEGFRYTLFFCEECGSPIYAEPASQSDKFVIQVGTLDDVELLERTPAVELNVKHRLGWTRPIETAEQREKYT